MDYAEVSDFTLKKLFYVPSLEAISTDPQFNVLSSVDTTKKILILGNSFISTSNIGNILGEMIEINRKTAAIEAVSRGYATVATYAADTTRLNNMRNGEYGVVFICGFYVGDIFCKRVLQNCRKCGIII